MLCNSQRNLKRILGMRQPVDKCIFVSDRNVSGPVLQRSVSGPSELGGQGAPCFGRSEGQVILKVLLIIFITLLLLPIFQTSYGPAGVAQDPKEDKEGINDHEE